MSQIVGLREVSYLSTGQVAEILIPEPQRNPMNRYRRRTLQDIESIRRILTERERG